MPKAFVNTGNADANVIARTNGDVLVDGKLYQDGDSIKNWSHDQLLAGQSFAVKKPHTYQVIVNAVFKDQGTATVSRRDADGAGPVLALRNF